MSDAPRTLTALRSAVAARLRARQEEIHEAVIHRAFSIAPPSGREAPGYPEALRAAIPSAVEHAFGAIELGEERVGPTPAAVLVQAAASARSEVGLEVVMRRYAAGYSTISDFLQEEIRALGGTSIGGYTMLQRDLTALFDRFVVEVSETYREEDGRSLPSPRQRQLERVRRLLAGDLVDPAGIDYPLGVQHLSVIVSSIEPVKAAAALARRLDRHLLVGESSMGRCAVWLGGPVRLEAENLDPALQRLVDEGHRLSVGEQGEGLAGWRRSRRQAEAAWLVSERGPAPLVRYGDVALVAAALRDPDLSHFLTETYAEPLSGERSSIGQTVRTFFELGRNASSAGAALGIARQTVASRLQVAEERLGRPLEGCAAQLETALRLVELDR
jgi:PucR C-terminal helix-turn-helix domain